MADKPIDEKEIFNSARQIPAPEERQAYVETACAGDPAAVQRILELLRIYDQERSFLESSPVAQSATIDEPMSERPGTTIGPYKLLEEIGEGGFGVVFLAEQTEPVRRRVALKVLKPGMDTRQVVARFEAERQALAIMDHANIAKVYDGGATPSGRPYFVMELVKGVPITDFCDHNHLTPRQRLELFIPVCQAIQHAHQKGIIHRDLKPSNILIAAFDGKPVVKVIDFGVAKATGQQLTDATLFTGFGAVVGTPEYMSPEQAEANNQDIDTRSDIYSLGVLLYELLTGSTPLTRKRVKEAALLEVLRVIREEEPPKPSNRLSSTDELPSISAQRHTEPAKLTKLVRGELDWIVMKALEKDRNRRYDTANAFAMDVQCYLANEPVAAGRPSALYRVRKFLRRNRALVSAAALMLLLLLAGVVGTTIGLIRAEQALVAEAERAEGEKRAKHTAEARLIQVEKGIDLLGSIFEKLDPAAEEKEGLPLRMLLGNRLDQAAAELEGEAVGDALVVARLQDRLARTYLGLGHPGKAEALFTKSLMTRRAHLGAEDPLTLRSMFGQGQACHQGGKTDDAIKLLEQVRDVQSKNLGPNNLETLSTLSELASVYWLMGDAKKAAELLEHVRDERVKQLGEEHEDTLATFRFLAILYAVKKAPEAIRLAEKVLAARQRQYPKDHPLVINAMSSLGFVYRDARKMKDALVILEQARDAAMPSLGPYHPQTLRILHSLAQLYRAYGQTALAITVGEEVRERRLMLLGPDHPATLDSLYDLGLTYHLAHKLEKALPLLEQAVLGLERRKFAQVNARIIIAALCDCQEDLKLYDQAEIWRRKLLALVKAKDGPEVPAYAEQVKRLVKLYDAWGKRAEADHWRNELEAVNSAPPKEDPP
jgi:serine/threonine protein kinase